MLDKSAAVFVALAVSCGLGCRTTTEERVRVYSPGGQVSQDVVRSGDRVVAELHRLFDTTVVTGEGIFDHANEGLARQAALALAQSDLAQKVQVQVRGNTVVMNATDVRSIVETNVNALIQNYTIDLADYDVRTSRYRLRISVRGEQLVKEIEIRRGR